MLYQLQGSEFQAQIETWDGKVVRATPSMRWAIDWPITVVLKWLKKKEITWSITDRRSPKLADKSLRLVTDEEIAQRTSP
jgi:hypothetical protein